MGGGLKSFPLNEKNDDIDNLFIALNYENMIITNNMNIALLNEECECMVNEGIVDAAKNVAHTIAEAIKKIFEGIKNFIAGIKNKFKKKETVRIEYVEKVVEKEVPVEKTVIKEVPVEKIKEVIKKVEVEKPKVFTTTVNGYFYDIDKAFKIYTDMTNIIGDVVDEASKLNDVDQNREIIKDMIYKMCKKDKGTNPTQSELIAYLVHENIDNDDYERSTNTTNIDTETNMIEKCRRMMDRVSEYNNDLSRKIYNKVDDYTEMYDMMQKSGKDSKDINRRCAQMVNIIECLQRVGRIWSNCAASMMYVVTRRLHTTKLAINAILKQNGMCEKTDESD
jgi:hypothetical protein